MQGFPVVFLLYIRGKSYGPSIFNCMKWTINSFLTFLISLANTFWSVTILFLVITSWNLRDTCVRVIVHLYMYTEGKFHFDSTEIINAIVKSCIHEVYKKWAICFPLCESIEKQSYENTIKILGSQKDANLYKFRNTSLCINGNVKSLKTVHVWDE